MAYGDGIIRGDPETTEVVHMCHDGWMRGERQRDERFEEELRYLLDERQRPEPPTPVAERERDERPAEDPPFSVELGTRA